MGSRLFSCDKSGVAIRNGELLAKHYQWRKSRGNRTAVKVLHTGLVGGSELLATLRDLIALSCVIHMTCACGVQVTRDGCRQA